jgi:hypothetical protein
MRLVGQVGFTSPYGLCNDRNGNIWVADLYGETLTKFDRSLDITRQFHTTHGAPGTCAVDPTTGNLAVTESVPSSGGFNLVIYKHARGSGTIISNPGQAEYYHVGYDRSGNLWVDGYDYSGKFILFDCRASSCSTIPISGGTIHGPGFLQWAVGQHSWYIADSFCNYPMLTFCIYPVSTSGVLGKPIRLKDAQGRTVCEMQEGAITDSQSRVLVGAAEDVLIGSRCTSGESASSVDRWSFPAGGTATNENTAGTQFPFGAAISAK